MGTALKGGKDGELDVGGRGGGQLKQNALEGGGSRGCFIFTSWLVGAFN